MDRNVRCRRPSIIVFNRSMFWVINSSGSNDSYGRVDLRVIFSVDTYGIQGSFLVLRLVHRFCCFWVFGFSVVSAGACRYSRFVGSKGAYYSQISIWRVRYLIVFRLWCVQVSTSGGLKEFRRRTTTSKEVVITQVSTCVLCRRLNAVCNRTINLEVGSTCILPIGVSVCDPRKTRDKRFPNSFRQTSISNIPCFVAVLGMFRMFIVPGYVDVQWWSSSYRDFFICCQRECCV